MARTAEQIREQIGREQLLVATSKSAQTRGYARERINYLRGELSLQNALEAAKPSIDRLVGRLEREIAALDEVLK